MPSLNYLTLVGGIQVEVGYYLDEFYWTAKALANANYDVLIITPQGNSPPMDPVSNNTRYFSSEQDWEDALAFVNSFKPLLQPVAMWSFFQESFHVEDFVGVFVPGGHSPLIDLMGNPTVGQILLEFVQADKPTGFICHGPIVAISMALLGPFPFVNRNMTVISTAEDIKKEELWNATIGYYPDKVLAAHGANVLIAPPFTSHVVVDGNLVTGQNPQSAEAFAPVFLSVLQSALKKQS